ncbi:HesA/MoeB/ThiF family protein [Olivibacter sitiensis]|uniref:HesA/MoeB/ThiF family protein n=1 Tax=Olivibacter sitiensis TaxID=376470 RepID=UPI00042545D6|nr:HesA/MoeB/ThiF family protein [Olivibacter sitiensis]
MDIKRYMRHITLGEIGILGQQRICEGSVLVIGAGGLGCSVLQALAASGVGTLGIVDGDRVSISNLHRQILYTDNDIGTPKVEAAKRAIRKINGETEVCIHSTYLNEQNAHELIGQYDVVVDGTDDTKAKYLISKACAEVGRSLVYAAIHKFQGQVAVFNFPTGDAKAIGYEDLFPQGRSEEQAPNCTDNGVLGVFPMILGNIQAGEVLKLLTGSGDVLGNSVLVYDFLRNEIFKYAIKKQFLSKADKGVLHEP